MLKRISYLVSVVFVGLFLAGCQSTSTSSVAYDDQSSSSSTSDSNFNVVYFDFDSSEIRQDQVSKIDAQVANIKSSSVTVEGHTDEVGTVDYNIALGERRASIVKDALVEKGVQESQITTVTYGKSRLADKSGSANARSANRRAVTVIQE